MQSYYGYHATHGGFANYKNGFSGLKYRKNRKDEYIAQQQLVSNTNTISVNEAQDTPNPTATPVDTLVNEVCLGQGRCNEEMRLNSTNAPSLEFAADSQKSNVSMSITPMKKPESGKPVPLRKDDTADVVRFHV